jgi:hypothetical protein
MIHLYGFSIFDMWSFFNYMRGSMIHFYGFPIWNVELGKRGVLFCEMLILQSDLSLTFVFDGFYRE